jgi:DNA-binding transcriptional regulator YdaS (Cro superfamily)
MQPTRQSHAAQFRIDLDELGLSQRAFARLIGEPPSKVNRWATGRTPMPRGWQKYATLLRAVKDFHDQVLAP